MELQNVANKSKFIADAIREKIQRQNKRRLNELLIQGYRATREEDKKINEEWEKITLEEWR